MKLLEEVKNHTIESEFGVYRVTSTPTEDGFIVERYQQFYTDHITPDQFEDFKQFYYHILDVDEALFIIAKELSN